MNVEQGAYMQCHIIRQLLFSVEHKEYKIDVAVEPTTDDFIFGLAFLPGHHNVVDIDNCVVTTDRICIDAERV